MLLRSVLFHFHIFWEYFVIMVIYLTSVIPPYPK